LALTAPRYSETVVGEKGGAVDDVEHGDANTGYGSSGSTVVLPVKYEKSILGEKFVALVHGKYYEHGNYGEEHHNAGHGGVEHFEEHHSIGGNSSGGERDVDGHHVDYTPVGHVVSDGNGGHITTEVFHHGEHGAGPSHSKKKCSRSGQYDHHDIVGGGPSTHGGEHTAGEY
jgi:hypothetical protein